MRIAMGIEYNGYAFSGWQVQHETLTVQGCVEQALSKVANHPVVVTCAGRTDAGVHALGQVIHFDCEIERKMHSWVFGANANLPKEISVLWAIPVSEDFHARFSAVRRRYRYLIFNRPIRPSVEANRVAWEYRPLNEARMIEAARYLVGEHDFSSFRAYACQAKSPVRKVTTLEIRREGQYVVIDIEANAFLHHMVRNIAGVLIEIGTGKQEPHWAREVLEAKDRIYAGATAPPHGLYLMQVHYPENFALPPLSPSPVVCYPE